MENALNLPPVHPPSTALAGASAAAAAPPVPALPVPLPGPHPAAPKAPRPPPSPPSSWSAGPPKVGGKHAQLSLPTRGNGPELQSKGAPTPPASPATPPGHSPTHGTARRTLAPPKSRNSAKNSSFGGSLSRDDEFEPVVVINCSDSTSHSESEQQLDQEENSWLYAGSRRKQRALTKSATQNHQGTPPSRPPPRPGKKDTIYTRIFALTYEFNSSTRIRSRNAFCASHTHRDARRMLENECALDIVEKN